MDPRNPLARLDRIARHPSVATLQLRIEPDGEAVRRAIDVVTRDGERRTFEVGAHASFVDLLDRVQRHLERGAARRGRAIRSARRMT